MELAIRLQQCTSCNKKKKKISNQEKAFSLHLVYAVIIGVRLTLGQVDSFCLCLKTSKIDIQFKLVV